MRGNPRENPNLIWRGAGHFLDVIRYSPPGGGMPAGGGNGGHAVAVPQRIL